MYQLDKEQFGSFVAQLRKEKGMTQKELAQTVMVTDKAVSKWERGLSLPDVALMVPLAQALGVTATELLECRRVDMGGLSPQQIEALVKKAVALSDPEPERRLRKKNLILWLSAVGMAILEMLGLLTMEESTRALLEGLGLVMVICGVFSGFFWLYVRERLPRYYDENRIGAFSDGPLRMNLPGMAFNNRNWPYILWYLRWWSLLGMWLSPLLWLAGSRWVPVFWAANSGQVMALVLILTLLPPIWYLAKKYES